MQAAGAGWGRALWALLVVCAAAQPGPVAAAGQAELVLQVPADLRVGQHARVLIEVRLPPEAAEPLLVTPYREGAALEVVKGRLLRSDAQAGAGGALRFELPVLALAPGAAVIGVRLLAYLCQQQCRALELERRANVVVLPP